VWNGRILPSGKRAAGKQVSMNGLSTNNAKSRRRFIAALDQSGGSTPQALKLYGIERPPPPDAEMFEPGGHECAPATSSQPRLDGDANHGRDLFG